MIGTRFAHINMLRRFPLYRLMKNNFTTRARLPSTALLCGCVGAVSSLFCFGVGYAIYVKRQPRSVWLECEAIFEEIQELLDLAKERRELKAFALQELYRMKEEVQTQLTWSKKICNENEDILGDVIKLTQNHLGKEHNLVVRISRLRAMYSLFRKKICEGEQLLASAKEGDPKVLSFFITLFFGVRKICIETEAVKVILQQELPEILSDESGTKIAERINKNESEVLGMLSEFQRMINSVKV